MRAKTYLQKGQTLLVMILLSTILATIGLSIAQSTIQDNQAAQLEEQTKRAFFAAEAGIEAALKRKVDILNGDLEFPGIKRLTATYTTSVDDEYETQVLENNRQFTFYLSSYNSDTATFGTPLLSTQLIEVTPTDLDLGTLCSSETTAFAVELTFIDTTQRTIFRRLIDHCDLIEDTVDEWDFDTQTQLGQEAHMVIVRIIGATPSFDGARLTIHNPSDNWAPQGKAIVSEAETTTGVVKRIRLFSSYPQIPPSLFVPSF